MIMISYHKVMKGPQGIQTCLCRCGKQWVSRVAHPAQCPKCKSPYWDKERVRPAKIARLMTPIVPEGSPALPPYSGAHREDRVVPKDYYHKQPDAPVSDPVIPAKSKRAKPEKVILGRNEERTDLEYDS